MSEPNCKLCGKCCHVLIDGEIFKCKNLKTISGGKMICRIYPRRLGTIIYPGRFKCGMRVQSKYDYPDCPFNTGKPLAPEYCEVKK